MSFAKGWAYKNEYLVKNVWEKVKNVGVPTLDSVLCVSEVLLLTVKQGDIRSYSALLHDVK